MTATDVDDVAASFGTRADRVADAVAQWRGELVALGGRDPLLSFRDLKVGTLDLAAAEPEARQRLLGGQPTVLVKLFPHEPLRSSALRSTRAIRDKARELTEERGLSACHLAVGVATWANPFAAHRPTVPVLLRPATVVARDPAETDFVLTVTDEPFVNPALLHALDAQLGLRFTADDLRDAAGRLRYPSVVERLREFAPAHVVDGFSIAHRAVLATFVTESLALADDLAAFGVDLEQHEVVAALAGDEPARAGIRAGRHITRPEFLAFDADADQEGVVGAVAAGGHLLVDGPPGSGRTQAVAAIVAELVGQGERVLVVGQKRAALADLMSRLRGAGLADIALDIGACSAAEAVDQIVYTASRLASGSAGDASAGSAGSATDERTLPAVQARLDAYLDAVHRPREPWGSSAYDAMVALATTPAEARTSVRIPRAALARGESADALHALLREYFDLEGLTLTEDGSPWFGADAHTDDDAEDLLAAAVGLRESAAPNLHNAATRAAVEVGLAGPTSLDDCLDIVDLLAGVAQTVKVFGPYLWKEPIDDLIAATAGRGMRAGTEAAPGILARRRLRAQVRELTAGSGVDRPGIHERLVAARTYLAEWRERSRDGRLPRTGPHLPDALEAAEAVAGRLARLAEANPRAADVGALPFAEARRHLDLLIADQAHLRAMPRLRELEGGLAACGLDGLVAELRGQTLSPERVAAILDHARLASALELWRESDPALRDFDVAVHEQALDAFRVADTVSVQAAAGRVLDARAARFTRVCGDVEGQAAVVAEWSDHNRPATLRELLDAAPDVALAAVPCWVMSPLTVASLLPARHLFDVVVVEDAGRVTVAQAVPAIVRAARTVLVGDDEVALTAFTTAVEPAPDPDEHEGPWGDEPAPSVVEVLRDALPSRTLGGQYRVRDHRLAGFAAGSAYAGRMRLVPGVGGPGGVSVDLVEAAAGGDDPVDSSSTEVQRVVQLVLDHMRTRPHLSLGVVTLGPRHATRIDAALRRALVRAPEVAAYLHEDRAEPFFVKDVERVAGDVRDAVILSLGYGRSVDGRILYRFGALGRPGGERRLVTAATRARDRMTVVSTFSADDLSPRRLSTPGAQALGDFLAYAEGGGATPDDTQPDDALATVIAERLRAAGASVVIGHGGRHGVSVAVRHPTRTNRFVLAVETDGHAYAARGEARERDRLRRVHLARLGWTVHAAWSAAWAADSDGEAARLVAAYERAVADADAYDWAVAAAEADVVAGMPEPEDDAGPADAGGDTTGGTTGDTTGDARPGAQRTAPRPAVARSRTVSEYTGRELAALARWVESDGLGRSEDDVVRLMADDLALDAADSRTGEVLRHAVRVGRAGAPMS